MKLNTTLLVSFALLTFTAQAQQPYEPPDFYNEPYQCSSPLISRTVAQGILQSNSDSPVTVAKPPCAPGIYLFRADGRSVRFVSTP